MSRLAVLQFAGEGVDRVGHLSHLGRALRRDPHRPLAGRESPGTGGGVLQRAGQPAGHQGTGDARDQQPDRGGGGCPAEELPLIVRGQPRRLHQGHRTAAVLRPALDIDPLTVQRLDSGDVPAGQQRAHVAGRQRQPAPGRTVGAHQDEPDPGLHQQGADPRRHRAARREPGDQHRLPAKLAASLPLRDADQAERDQRGDQHRDQRHHDGDDTDPERQAAPGTDAHGRSAA